MFVIIITQEIWFANEIFINLVIVDIFIHRTIFQNDTNTYKNIDLVIINILRAYNQRPFECDPERRLNVQKL